MKLQEAYASESNAMGGWKLIGYQAPGNNKVTTNFTYSGAIDETGSTTTTTPDAWKAAANVALNDCAANSGWSIQTAIAATTGVVSFTASLSDAANCNALTPNFTKIGK